MTIAPHSGIVDFGTFTPPAGGKDGIQGEVPAPLTGQETYVLTATGWATGGGGGTVTQINTGTGLSGGPITSSGTISLANTAVTPGSYTNANITVDQQGRVTLASNGSAGGVTSVTASSPLASSGGAMPNISLTGILGISNGGTGTSTPALVAGTNVTITGSWPNQTINASSTMVYPAAGIPNSTGSAWGTSYSTTGSGTVVALATSPVFTTPNIGVATATSVVFPDATQSFAAETRGQIEQQRLGAFT